MTHSGKQSRPEFFFVTSGTEAMIRREIQDRRFVALSALHTVPRTRGSAFGSAKPYLKKSKGRS